MHCVLVARRPAWLEPKALNPHHSIDPGFGEEWTSGVAFRGGGAMVDAAGLQERKDPQPFILGTQKAQKYKQLVGISLPSWAS